MQKTIILIINFGLIHKLETVHKFIESKKMN